MGWAVLTDERRACLLERWRPRRPGRVTANMHVEPPATGVPYGFRGARNIAGVDASAPCDASGISCVATSSRPRPCLCAVAVHRMLRVLDSRRGWDVPVGEGAGLEALPELAVVAEAGVESERVAEVGRRLERGPVAQRPAGGLPRLRLQLVAGGAFPSAERGLHRLRAGRSFHFDAAVSRLRAGYRRGGLRFRHHAFLRPSRLARGRCARRHHPSVGSARAQ